jgi:hypothetical protein
VSAPGYGPRSHRWQRPDGAQPHLYGEDREASEALRAALEAGTYRTSGLAPVQLTRDEAELALRALWRAGWRLVPRQ